MKKQLVGLMIVGMMQVALPAANAVMLCARARPDGSFNTNVKIREACSPTERMLDAASLGLQGPQGPQGPKGDPGTGASDVFTHAGNGINPLSATQYASLGSIELPAGSYSMVVQAEFAQDDSTFAQGSCQLRYGTRQEWLGDFSLAPDRGNLYSQTFIATFWLDAPTTVSLDCRRWTGSISQFGKLSFVATRVGTISAQ